MATSSQPVFHSSTRSNPVTSTSPHQRTYPTESQPLIQRESSSSSSSPPPSKYVSYTSMLICLAITALVGLLAYFLFFSTSSPSSPTSTCQHPSVKGTHGMVTTTNEHATRIGLNILKAGGNAMDAAVAIQFALSVVTPQSTSIGGGCFLLYYHASSKTLSALDGREEAPNRYNASAFCKNPKCHTQEKCDCSDGVWPFYDRVTGGHPVGVPGVLRAMERALREHGTLTLSQAMRPAIELARDGFPVYDEMHARLIMNRDRMIQYEGTKNVYFTEPGAMPKKVGETFTNPDLANTLELIGDKGVDIFYKGSLAKEIIQTVQNAVNPVTGLSGVMELSDLEGYRAVYRRPVHIAYRDYDVYSMPLPSSGGISLLQALNYLENYDMSGLRPTTIEYLHRLIDAQDLAFADRDTYLADSDWVHVPVHALLNKTYAHDRLTKFAHPIRAARPLGKMLPSGKPPGHRAENWPYAGASLSNKAGTTHMVVADQHGNVVTMTTTIEENFGSGVVVPKRGFLLNNELTDFEPLPEDGSGRPFANSPAGGKRRRSTAMGSLDSNSVGGKRPLSSMAPTMVFHHGKPYLAIGSPGGSRIIGTVLNALVNTIDGNMCLGDAIAAPRALSRNAPVEFEQSLMNQTDIVEGLRERDFEIVKLDTPRPMGYVEAIRFTDDGMEGSADVTRMPNAAAEGW